MSELKELIDNMSYMELLEKIRFAPSEDPIFQGKNGVYFYKVMSEKKDTLSDGELSRISKAVGW